ncbi:palmitoyltransferase ZDHHC8B [Cololabis saira]|uniref:palmitoyltransferase ZDHHC8B n=1 Tax=Cololabis saira TaxID=129043 RepID=UPI002AD451ED|nr:palmitoyltransferase ZDHHC8B [Cololabis saira]
MCLLSKSSLSGKTHPSTPAMYKFRPSFGTMPKVHYHTAGEKIVLPDERKTSAILEESVRGHDYRSEPNLDLPEYANAPLHRTFQSSPLQLDQDPGGPRSLSLKTGPPPRLEKGHLRALPAQTVTSSGPYRGAFSPNTLSNRNGSLSYDSLLNPSVSPAGECVAHRGVGFHSPYLPNKMCHIREPEMHRQQVAPPYSPVMPVKAAVGRQSPHLRDRDRDSSPVRYDNLSQTIMASIQERKEMEEREKRKLLHGRSQTHICVQDSAVFDGGYGLNTKVCYPDGGHGPASRGPTPPAYGGSRDNLMGVGLLSYGQRTPAMRFAGSTMGRAPRSSSTSLHTDPSSSGSSQGRAPGPPGPPGPPEGPYCSPVHQPRSPAMPRSPSYSHHKLSYISAQERTDSPRLGGPRENMKVNGQMDCHVSPSRHGNVKKVTGVGGTTYEISV